MDPVRSSLGGGIAATAALLVFLLVADLLLAGTNLFVFATFTSLCAVGGAPYCELGSPTATFLTFIWFGLLYAVAWPLLFAGFTWGLPGETGLTHGAVYGLILWAGYVVAVLYGISIEGQTLGDNLPMVVVTLLAYLVYGVVLGAGYDYLAEHRTFLSERQPT
ncbi:DUF6789 family protein [Halobellus limi]|uniref:Uncharacterized protein n=1 Tax=Halobellus limi TaxID=699433 RepID=A0A1H5UY18_9EURY|nr:DUF6789 family protein [Halobellus limi]QCC46902.1 hypothetical protein DV707_04025 [Halobellus limi]SEF79107.1 hypothetical protein SAMN04488133_0749 [Halobellus limi]